MRVRAFGVSSYPLAPPQWVEIDGLVMSHDAGLVMMMVPKSAAEPLVHGTLL